MAGEQADDVPGALINHHHRRVAELVIHQRGQHPHGNPVAPIKISAEKLLNARALVKSPLKDKPFLQRFAGVR